MSKGVKVHLPAEWLEAITIVASEIASKNGIAAYQEEAARYAKELPDRRLRNTKLLLRNYRMFKSHAQNAVYSAQEVDEDEFDITDLMSERYSDSDMFVESIKQSVLRTVTIVDHVTTMLKLYEMYCRASGNPEDIRRWNVVYELYVDETPKTIKQLANEYVCAERTIYRDIDDACEKLAALIFGIDGIVKC